VGHIFVLAFLSAASLAAQLLVIVLVILTRPRPRALLWSFWLTALLVSLGASYIILVVFRTKGTILGTTASKVSPTVYLVIGGIALALALFAATKRGRELLGRELERAQQKQAEGKGAHEGSLSQRASAKADEVRSKAEEALKRGSVWVAIVVGVVLGAPTAFTPLAIGKMVTNGYRLPTQLLLIVAFSKFLSGAWITVLLIPLIVLGFDRVHRHYQQVKHQLTLHGLPPSLRPVAPARVVIPISGVHRGMVNAVLFAQSISSNVTGVYVELEEGGGERGAH